LEEEVSSEEEYARPHRSNDGDTTDSKNDNDNGDNDGRDDDDDSDGSDNNDQCSDNAFD
jgi:hypothetical protein